MKAREAAILNLGRLMPTTVPKGKESRKSPSKSQSIVPGRVRNQKERKDISSKNDTSRKASGDTVNSRTPNSNTN